MRLLKTSIHNIAPFRQRNRLIALLIALAMIAINQNPRIITAGAVPAESTIVLDVATAPLRNRCDQRVGYGDCLQFTHFIHQRMPGSIGQEIDSDAEHATDQFSQLSQDEYWLSLNTTITAFIQEKLCDYYQLLFVTSVR